MMMTTMTNANAGPQASTRATRTVQFGLLPQSGFGFSFGLFQLDTIRRQAVEWMNEWAG